MQVLCLLGLIYLLRIIFFITKRIYNNYYTVLGKGNNFRDYQEILDQLKEPRECLTECEDGDEKEGSDTLLTQVEKEDDDVRDDSGRDDSGRDDSGRDDGSEDNVSEDGGSDDDPNPDLIDPSYDLQQDTSYEPSGCSHDPSNFSSSQ